MQQESDTAQETIRSLEENILEEKQSREEAEQELLKQKRVCFLINSVSDFSKILCRKILKAFTHYHTIPTFNDLLKTFLKRRNAGKPIFSPFPAMFSTFSKREISILATLFGYGPNIVKW